MHQVIITVHQEDGQSPQDLQALVIQGRNQAYQTIGMALAETAANMNGEPLVVRVHKTDQVLEGGDIQMTFEVSVNTKEKHPYSVGYADAPGMEHNADYWDDDLQRNAYLAGFIAGCADYRDGVESQEMEGCDSPIYRAVCGIPNTEEAHLDGRQDRAGGINLLGNPWRWDSECSAERKAAKAWSEGWRIEHNLIQANRRRAAQAIAEGIAENGEPRFDWSKIGEWGPSTIAHNLGYVAGWDDEGQHKYNPYPRNPYDGHTEQWVTWMAAYDRAWSNRLHK